MNKKAAIIIVLILAAIIALSIIFFRMFFIQYEREIRTSPSMKAIINPFLAAERFINKIGGNAESISGRSLLINLPDKDDTIIINRLGGNLPDNREQMLIAWIEKGGNLIIAANRLWDKKLLKTGNHLLDRYNIRPTRKSKENYYKKAVTDIDLGKDGKLEVEFITSKILIDSKGIAKQKYYDENGNHVLVIQIKQGKLIILSDDEFLRNTNLGKNDHSYYLAKLVQNRSKIWLLYSSNMPSIFSILWDNIAVFIICLAVLLLFCILRLNLRTGPLIVENPVLMRNLMDHLKASGNYYFKLSKGRYMVKKVQKAALNSLKERYLFSKGTSNLEKSQLIAKQTDIPAEKIYSALFDDSIEGNDNFINNSAILQYLINGRGSFNDYKKNINKG